MSASQYLIITSRRVRLTPAWRNLAQAQTTDSHNRERHLEPLVSREFRVCFHCERFEKNTMWKQLFASITAFISSRRVLLRLCLAKLSRSFQMHVCKYSRLVSKCFSHPIRWSLAKVSKTRGSFVLEWCRRAYGLIWARCHFIRRDMDGIQSADYASEPIFKRNTRVRRLALDN